MIFVSRECLMTTISTLIPEDVAQFIIEKIDSVAQMEALLMLRENPQQQWDVKPSRKGFISIMSRRVKFWRVWPRKN